jgi:hypothetical protein
MAAENLQQKKTADIPTKTTDDLDKVVESVSLCKGNCIDKCKIVKTGML